MTCGVDVTATTGAWCLMTLVMTPVTTSHTLAVASSDAVISRWPSWLNSTSLTAAECPRSRAAGWRVARSQMIAVLSSDADALRGRDRGPLTRPRLRRAAIRAEDAPRGGRLLPWDGKTVRNTSTKSRSCASRAAATTCRGSSVQSARGPKNAWRRRQARGGLTWSATCRAACRGGWWRSISGHPAQTKRRACAGCAHCSATSS